MDGGGYEPIDSLVSAGVVEPWVLPLRENKIEALDLACLGYWPENVDDPKSKIVAPSDSTWTKVGMVAFEGMTSGGDMMMGALRDKSVSLSQDPSYKYVEGSKTYSGSNMAYFGFVQDRIYDYVKKSHLIPCEKVLWSALESRGEEDGVKVYGPAIAGKKATGKAGQWFGNTLHFEMLQWEESIEIEPEKGKKLKQTVVQSKPIMYLRNHADPVTKMTFPAKTRAPFQLAGEVPTWMEADLDKFYTFLDELRERAKKTQFAVPSATSTNASTTK